MNHLARGTGIVSLLTLISRIFGFIRDLLVARLLGATLLADSFFVAFRIPNLLRSFVAEGALSSAFVPIFSHELAKGKEHAKRVLSEVTGFLICVTIALTVIFFIFAEEVVRLIAPGFEDTPNFALCVELTRIMMPYIIFISLIAMLNGALNSVKIFGVSAMAQVIMNLVLITGAVIAGFFDGLGAVKILSISVLVGGLVQVIWQIPTLRRSGFNFWPKINFRSPVIKELLILMAPALLGATVYQISQFINTLLASLLETGSVSWVFYADRLTQLPIGVFSIALASVLLPTLSAAHASGDSANFEKSLLDSLRYTSFIMIPVSFATFIFAEPLIRVMFERGAFDARSTYQTAQVVRGYTLGLWAVSCHSMLVRAFLAQKDTRTSVMVGIFSLILSVALSLLLMGELPGDSSSTLAGWLNNLQQSLGTVFPLYSFGASGLALASSFAAIFSFICLMVLLSSRIKDISWHDFTFSTLRVLAACALAFSVMLLYSKWLTWNDWHLIPALVLCGALFILLSYILGSRELAECTAIFKRKFGRN